MDLWDQIKNNTELHTMLMRECDICFYKQLQEIQFMENNENYSMQAKAFAHDASGGEFAGCGNAVLYKRAFIFLQIYGRYGGIYL